MNYKISIIIAIYNAEKYLENTIQSIINQSIGFENIELILVDDASKDNSKKIIEDYSKKYDNIIPHYSEKNHGYPGFGRNIGLKKATSDYLMFIDNDDEYDKDICKTLYETIINENADIVVCGKLIVNENNTFKEKINYVYSTEEDGKVILRNNELFYFNSHIVLNKIFKNEIIKTNNLNFFENTRLDDDMFTWDYYINSEKLIYLKNYYGYYWNVHSSSLSHTNSEQYIYEIIDCIRYEFNQLKKQNKEEHIQFRAKNAINWLIFNCCFLKLNNKEFKNTLKKIYDFEKEINFNGTLNRWANPINKLILHKHFNAALLLLKFSSAIRKSKVIQMLGQKVI